MQGREREERDLDITQEEKSRRRNDVTRDGPGPREIGTQHAQ